MTMIALMVTAMREAPVSEPIAPPGSSSGFDPDALIAAHNRERAADSLPPLRANAQLSEAARNHARDMAEHRELSHKGSDGSDPATRVKRGGYRFRAVGENVAAGQESVEEAMRTWMNSPPHRSNILGDFAEVGAAVIPDADKRPYWCVVFGRPRPEADLVRGPAALITALNRARSDAKQAPVEEAAELARVASDYARDLAGRRTIEAKNGDRPTPFEILERQRYPARRMALLLASGASEPATVVRSWLGREQERKDLFGDFDGVGAGVAVDGDGVPYWVLLLARK
jgi:uncharacterized protein YkwD